MIGVFPFKKRDVWEAFLDHFKLNVPWEKTAFYKRLEKQITRGCFLWNCRTIEELGKRMQKIDRLYKEIQKDGYYTQEEIAHYRRNHFKKNNEIGVCIGRNGDYIFANGRHRLCIALLLGLCKVPVQVIRRHKNWVLFSLIYS